MNGLNHCKEIILDWVPEVPKSTMFFAVACLVAHRAANGSSVGCIRISNFCFEHGLNLGQHRHQNDFGRFEKCDQRPPR